MSRAPHLHAVTSVDMATTLRIPHEWKAPLAGFDAELRAAGRPHTTRAMRHYQLKRFAADHPDTAPSAIGREDLITWLGSRTWAPETRRAYRSALTTFYRWMHATGQVTEDPAAKLPKVVLPRSLPRPAPDTALLEGLTTKDERARLAIEIIDATGLRRGEAAALHSRQLIETIDGPVLHITGKGGHERLIPVPNRIAYRIRAVDGYVFPGQIDGHLSPHYLGKLISEGLPGKWTAHTLRHRYATRVYRATSDLLTLQKLLGHASVRTTEIYVGLTDDRLRGAAETAWGLPNVA